VLGEMLGEFERITNISVPASVLECLMNSSQLTPPPFKDLRFLDYRFLNF